MSAPDQEATQKGPWRNFYGRQRGKKLRPGQQAHIDTTLKRIAVPGAFWDENPDRAPVDLAALFPGKPEVWLEIGFGAGEHMLAQAKANPEVGIIGCEPFMNGVAAFLSHMDRAGIENVRVHAGDAREVFDILPDASIDRLFLLYPDPWPKTRHHKRRFVSAENLAQIVRVLKPGAQFRIASDIPDYIRHSLEAIARCPELTWLAERPEDWRAPWSDWPGTRYEAKALREGRTPCYLTFRRD
jgi:tRNA (guanine-N7-)-methyltransferase